MKKEEEKEEKEGEGDTMKMKQNASQTLIASSIICYSYFPRFSLFSFIFKENFDMSSTLINKQVLNYILTYTISYRSFPFSPSASSKTRGTALLPIDYPPRKCE